MPKKYGAKAKKLSKKWMREEIPRSSGLFPAAKPDFPLVRLQYPSGKDRASRSEIPPEDRWPTFQTASRKKIKNVMHAFKAGTLKSGRSGKKVRNQNQTVAIGMAQRVLGKSFPSAISPRSERGEADRRRNAWKAFRADPTKPQPERGEIGRKGTFPAPSRARESGAKVPASNPNRHELFNFGLAFTRLFA